MQHNTQGNGMKKVGLFCRVSEAAYTRLKEIAPGKHQLGYFLEGLIMAHQPEPTTQEERIAKVLQQLLKGVS